MTPANTLGQFGDTTYTKVFVGGLAWETQNETLKKYFDQFGEILEAVVITDKITRRSKGYGFVTFRDPYAAKRACVDASPVIDGRRANCNLASLGVQRSKPPTPQHGGGRNFRVVNAFKAAGFQGGAGTAFPSAATFPLYAIQQGILYNVYGYSSNSPDYTYPTNCYSMHGEGASTPYPFYGAGASVMLPNTTGTFFPYLELGQGNDGASSYPDTQGHGIQYPYHPFQYPLVNSTGFLQHYVAPMSLTQTLPLQAGVTVALTAPSAPDITPRR